jgi:NAD(P) transhydrogenase subunit alpha
MGNESRREIYQNELNSGIHLEKLASSITRVKTMRIGLPKESQKDEFRVALAPETVKKFIKKGFQVLVEKTAGVKAGFLDSEYQNAGAELVDPSQAWGAEVVLKVLRPSDSELAFLKSGTLLMCLIDPFAQDQLLEKLAQKGISTVGMEMVPRTSRAQSMDVLSSQANIAGYRAVIEAVSHYKRFTPLMMTSAGSAKPAKVMVLGAGVAGLQAIATAKRLGATVEAYDIRAEVKEQIQSLGAKVVELDVGEEGSGQGGYARELSADAKKRQQEMLTDRLKKCDIIISTANIPGRRAPVLITEEAVQGMRAGSVIVDLAAATGGNCPLTEAGKVIEKHGVILVGLTNYPSLMATDSSHFYGNNLLALLQLMTQEKEGQLSLKINLEDDIVQACLVTDQGAVRFKRK